MSKTRATFWTHGVNTISEFPDRSIAIRRTGYGTIVQQVMSDPKIQNNWFHIPLHTVNVSDGLISFVEEVDFRLGINDYAKLREVHVRYGHELIYKDDVDMDGPDVEGVIDLSAKKLGGVGPKKLQNGLVLCLRVEFNSEIEPGEVIFYGGGIKYSQERG